MKILQFGDLHLDPATAENTRPAAIQILRAAEREKPDVIVNTGDLSWRRGHLAPWVGLELRQLHVALSKIAPVIVVAGNHDLSTSGERVGTVLGALAESAATERIHLFERPGVVRLGGVAFACMPYPSKHWLLAARPELRGSEILPELSAAIAEIVRGLAAEISPRERALLVFHGSIAGAKSDSELSMSTEIDLVLEEADVPNKFEAILCGHIHRFQQVGRAVYNGSPAPLSFAEEKSPHGLVVWEDTPLGFASQFIELPVARPLITVDRRGKGLAMVRPFDVDRFREANALPDLRDARVRVLAVCDPYTPETGEMISDAFKACGAAEVKLVIERTRQLRPAGPDVEFEAGMDRLLRDWAALPENAERLGPIAEELAAFSATIEPRLKPETVMRARASSYQLLRLYWSNWKSYGERNELVMEDLGRLIAIEGENAAGKSNAAEVEAFALYGRFIRGRQALAEAVRIGARDAMVSATFIASAAVWRVSRRIKINGRGIGASDLTLEQRVAGPEQPLRDPSPAVGWDYKPFSAGTARETQEFIERLVGPFDLYLKTRFASQGDIDGMLDLTPSEMKDVMQQALATEAFAERHELGAVEYANAIGRRNLFEAGLEAWKVAAESIPELTENAANAQEAAAAARVSLREVMEHEAACFERDRAAAESLENVERRLVAWSDSRRTKLMAEQNLSELLEAGERDQEKAAGLQRLTAELDALPALRAELAASQSQESDLARLRAELAAINATADGLADKCLRRVDDHHAILAGKRSLLETETQRHWSEMHRLTEQDERAKRNLAAAEQAWKHRIDVASRLASMISRTPFGEECVTNACPLIGEAVEARSRLAELSASRDAELESFGKEMTEIEERRGSASREIEDLRARTTSEIEVLERAFATEQPGLELQVRTARLPARELEDEIARRARDAPRPAETIEAEIDSLEARRPELAEMEAAAVRLAARESTLDLARGQLARAEAAFAALGDEPDAETAKTASLEARSALDLAKAQRRAADSDAETALSALGGAEERLRAALDAKAKLDESSAQLARLDRDVLIASEYQSAVSRDGLPYLLLSRALPALESHANHFLCDDLGSGLRIQIESARTLQSGEERTEVWISYQNDLGRHSLAAASGFERIAIGYALRAALALIQAEAQGLSVSHWIADEGWGVFDENNLVTVGQPMLRRLAERFGRVIVISHQAPIREICDTRLIVEADAVHGSSLRRAA